MNLKSAKVYNDGSHFIAIPSDAFPHRRRKLTRQNLRLKKDEITEHSFFETFRQKRFQTYLPSRRRIECRQIHNQVYGKVGRAISIRRKITNIFQVGYFRRRYRLSDRHRRPQSIAFRQFYLYQRRRNHRRSE